jgi:hypothetical protein
MLKRLSLVAVLIGAFALPMPALANDPGPAAGDAAAVSQGQYQLKVGGMS